MRSQWDRRLRKRGNSTWNTPTHLGFLEESKTLDRYSERGKKKEERKVEIVLLPL